MGLFALASTALSTYIWMITVWDVCRPLSVNMTSNNPSIGSFNILDLVRTRPKEVKRPLKRSHIRMENAQREEMRNSLKAVIVWLLLKGLEPVFDNSVGYVMPLYSLSKALILLVYVRFRLELSKHLFDSFVLPLGKPNTPLLDLGAFNSIVFPTARFLLSLPFAHLVVAVKNQFNPVLRHWLSGGDNSNRSMVEPVESVGIGRPPIDRVAPPTHRTSSSKVNPNIRSSSDSSRSASGSGRRGDGDGQGGGSLGVLLAARKKPSSESLSSLSRNVEPQSTTNAYALLETLPPAPRVSPVSRRSQAGSAAGTPSRPVLQTFAFIPPATPPSIQQKQMNAAIEPTHLFTPRMPGFLGGQAPSIGQNYASQNEKSLSAPTKNASHLAKNGNASDDTREGENEGSTIEKRIAEGQTFQTESKARSKTVTSGTRRKRTEEDPDIVPRKTRASPSKGRARARATPSSTTSAEADGLMKRSASTPRVPSSSLSNQTTQASSRATATRTRKKAA